MFLGRKINYYRLSMVSHEQANDAGEYFLAITYF